MGGASVDPGQRGLMVLVKLVGVHNLVSCQRMHLEIFLLVKVDKIEVVEASRLISLIIERRPSV